MTNKSLFIIGHSHPILENKLKNKFQNIYKFNFIELFLNEYSKKEIKNPSSCIFLPDLNFFKDFTNKKGHIEIEPIINKIEQLLPFFDYFIFSPLLNFDFSNNHPIYSWENILLKNNQIINHFFSNEKFIFINELDEDILERSKLRSLLMFNSKMTKAHIDYIFNSINRIEYQKKDPVKLIVVDADNTLWGGIASEDNFQDIILGSHSLEGELYIIFQKQLLALQERGFLLAICSKSNIKSSLNLIKNHPECILKKENFVSIKCSWGPKSESIKSIISEVNLRLESVLFIDDNFHEIDEVKSNLPEIKTLFLSTDIYSRPKQLRDSIYTTGEFPTLESGNRTKSYQDNIIRIKEKENLIDQGEDYQTWLNSLKTEVSARLVNNPLENNRIKQLMVRSRQFNTNPTLFKNTQSILKAKAYTFDLKDKHGQMGLIGLAVFCTKTNVFEISQIILSCRSFSRDIEKLIIFYLLKKWQDSKKKYIYFAFDKKIDKNNYGYNFLLRSKIKINENLNRDQLQKELYLKPNHLNLFYD